jgi:hypothetical protein
MSNYVPELLNELTRIVVTTRNDNPSVDEYDQVVPAEWKRCEAIKDVIREQGRSPSNEEMREVAQRVVRMLRSKHVPEAEIRERIDEAFQRTRDGAYPVDRSAVEAGLWG